MQKHRPFPRGLTFHPSDEELVESYLYKKVAGQAIPYVEYFIRDCDLYGEHEPSVIWNCYGGPNLDPREDLYVFTMLKKKGSRVCRQVASSAGAWEGEKAPEEIVSSTTNLPIGYKKRFRYEGEGSVDDRKWIMYEYSLHPSLLGANQTADYVICGIRRSQLKELENQETAKHKKPRGRKSNKRKRQEGLLESVSQTTTAMVAMLKEGTCYDTDFKMIDQQHVMPAAVPDQTQQESHQHQTHLWVNTGECQLQGTMATLRVPENNSLETRGIYKQKQPLRRKTDNSISDQQPFVAVALSHLTQQRNHQQQTCVSTYASPDESTIETWWMPENSSIEIGSEGYDLPWAEIDMSLSDQQPVVHVELSHQTQQDHQQQTCVSTSACPDEWWMPGNSIIETTETFDYEGHDLSWAEIDDNHSFRVFYQLPDLTVDDYFQFEDLNPLNEFGSVAN